tara:strand:+ start:515180 stop:516355 length:1176 start_codon:yes stop_codon:yes gene_type:complete
MSDELDWIVDWPDRIPKDQSALLGSLRDEDRAIVTRRLDALAKLARDEITVSEAGDVAGVSRATFHRIRKEWNESRSIAALVPFLARKGRPDTLAKVETISTDPTDGGGRLGEAGVADEIDQAEIVEWARTLVRRKDTLKLSNGAVARILLKSFDERISRPAATRLVQRLRREDRLDPGRLRSAYGEQLLVDFTAIGIHIEGAFGSQIALANVVLERASGLVLAANVCDRQDACHAQRVGLSEAIEFLSARRLDVGGESQPRIKFVSAEGPDGACNQGLVEALKSELGAKNFKLSGERRFGRSLVSIIGPRIGRIEIRSAATCRAAPLPTLRSGFFTRPMGLKEAGHVFRREIDLWNETVLKTIVKAVPAELRTNHGRMAAGLSGLLRAIS